MVQATTLEGQLTRAWTAKTAIAPGAAIQYVLAPGLRYPSLDSYRDVQQLKYMLAKYQVDAKVSIHEEEDHPLKYRHAINQHIKALDLTTVTADDIARAAMHANSEEWAVFSLNKGADPRTLFKTAAQSLYINGKPISYNLTKRLISYYGVNPNLGVPKQESNVVFDLLNSDHPFPYWFTDFPEINFNILVDGNPLIFYTPQLKSGKIGFNLLAKQVGMQVTNVLKQTPLHIGACYFSLKELYGVDIPKELINQPDAFGNTPAHFAAMGPDAKTGPNYENFQWLVQHGANLTIRNQRGETPLDILNQRIQKSATMAQEQANPQ